MNKNIKTFAITILVGSFMLVPVKAEEENLTKPEAPTAEKKATGLENETIPQFSIDKFDANKNGTLDPDEKAAWEKQVVTKYDMNHDGTLDAEELKKWKAAVAYMKKNGGKAPAGKKKRAITMVVEAANNNQISL
jgi:hypothetical protein